MFKKSDKKKSKQKLDKKRKKKTKKRNTNKKTGQQENIIPVMIYFTIFGFILCLVVLYILSGGKNYIRLYHDLDKYINTYDAITTEYYGKVKKDKLIDSSINAMISNIDDDYTNYNDKQTTNSFYTNVDGTYEGIGCTIAEDENKTIYVVSTFKNSPASKAGLKEDDIIKQIDGKKIKSSEDMANYVKNNKKSNITLTILRDDKEKKLVINREKIEVETISTNIIKNDTTTIGYIKISVFSSVTYKQFRKSLEKLEKKDKIDSLIIDVRDNNGGYLSSVTDIVSMFLKKGEVIYQLQNNKEKTKELDETKEHRKYKVAVLINGNSASASEILASAIKENYKNSEIIGMNSFGKGTVQKAMKLKDGTMLKYTVQKWLTPKGKWINEKGVTPTIKVAIDNKEDKQLDKAIEILKESKK